MYSDPVIVPGKRAYVKVTSMENAIVFTMDTALVLSVIPIGVGQLLKNVEVWNISDTSSNKNWRRDGDLEWSTRQLRKAHHEKLQMR